MRECHSILLILLCSYSPVSLASVHDLMFIVIVFHVVEQDLVEPGIRHMTGIMTTLLHEHVRNYNVTVCIQGRLCCKSLIEVENLVHT